LKRSEKCDRSTWQAFVDAGRQIAYEDYLEMVVGEIRVLQENVRVD